jgi:hypothetical protein
MNPTNKLIRYIKEYPLAVFCALVILFCVGFLILRGDATLELSAQELDLNSRIRTIDQNLKNSKNLLSDVEEVNRLVEQIEARLFNREQRAVNINFFYDLEDRFDVKINNISQSTSTDSSYATGGPRELKLHSTIGYDISLNGKFDGILTFLYELDRVSPFIRVADFQVGGGNRRANNPGVLDARLRLVVLAVKD